MFSSQSLRGDIIGGSPSIMLRDQTKPKILKPREITEKASTKASNQYQLGHFDFKSGCSFVIFSKRNDLNVKVLVVGKF